MRYGWDGSKQHSHALKCRKRSEQLSRQPTDDKHRVEEADRRQTRWLADQVREADLTGNRGVVEEPPVELHHLAILRKPSRSLGEMTCVSKGPMMKTRGRTPKTWTPEA